MSITITFPDEVAAAVPDVESAALRGVAVEGYRLGRLSLGQVARLINASVWDAGEMLAAHGCHLEQSAEEVEADLESLRQAMKK